MVNANWPTAVTGEADSVSTVSASACHIRGKLALVYGNTWLIFVKMT